MSSQAWKVVATTAQRFYVAQMLLSDELKGKGRKWDTALWRARVALGLIGLTEFAFKSREIATKLINEPLSHLFTVTAENADFILEAREKVELRTGVSAILRPLLEQLADGKDGRPVFVPEDLPEWTDALEPGELEQWKPPKATDPPDAA